MAKFIDLIENAGTIQDEKTGNEIKWRNFMVGYMDIATDADKGRNEVDSTEERYFQVKVKGDYVSSFFGFDIVGASDLNGAFGKEIDVIYGREGVAGIRFKEPYNSKLINDALKK